LLRRFGAETALRPRLPKQVPLLNDADRERFLECYANSLEVEGPLETPCLEWQYGRSPKGYGQFYYGAKGHLAHRVAWLVFKGEVPAGLEICHACDQTWCVNIEHLFVATHSENMRDMYTKGRDVSLFGEDHGLAKLTEDQVLEIYRMVVSGRYTQREIGRQFGVTQSTVSLIKHERMWTHLWQRPSWSTPQLEEITMPEWEAMQCSGEWTVVNEGGLRNAEAIDPGVGPSHSSQ
jgi:hypothetical protein